MLVDCGLFLFRNRVHRNHSFTAVQAHNAATVCATLLLVAFLVSTMVLFANTEAGAEKELQQALCLFLVTFHKERKVFSTTKQTL
jgi:hypothetical protein